MARRVRDQAVIEEAAADSKLDVLPRLKSWRPESELATPTSPAMSEKITKNPVARFPIG